MLTIDKRGARVGDRNGELVQLARSVTTRPRPIAVGGRPVAMGARPGYILTNRMRSLAGRPMGVGRSRHPMRVGQSAAPVCNPGHSQASPSGRMECETYGPPAQLVGPDGCDIGYNGCGDTIGINVTVAATATVDINVPAAIEFTPRYFIYTGAAATFTINRIFVANGPNSNFGAGYAAEYHGLASFTSKRVSWPTFYNSPPLTITVTNLTGAPAAFSGLLIGIASHQ